MKMLFRLLNWITGLGAVVFLYAAQQTDDFRCVLAGGGFLGLMVLFSCLDDRQRRKTNAQRPVIAVEATVVSHSTAQERVGNKHVTRYYITFRPLDGSQNLKFEVSELDFDDFDVGETGPLRYRGWEFLSFGLADKSGIAPMAPLPEEYEAKPEPKSAIQRAGELLSSLRKKATCAAGQKSDQQQKRKDILTHELDE